MLSHTRNDMFPKECVLLAAVEIHPPTFKRLRIDCTEVQPNSFADLHRSSECQAIDIAQTLRPDAKPVCIMTQRFERMYLDRIVAGDAVIIGI